ncbi:MAG: hypothetical protein HY817_03105 [Candidatus Abawacabacteria bacterium]|nr:hypothetical protein [Candidatus Abawacabacteria bacterium]
MARPQLEGKGHSLWLLPKADSSAHRDVNPLINRLAKVHGTPEFAVHATLIGSVLGEEASVRDQTRKIAARLRPYEIVGNGQLSSNLGVLHQTLFIPVIQTPPVMAAYDTAQHVLGSNRGPYFPHISLAYDGLTKEEVDQLKELLKQEEALIRNVRFTVNAIGLWQTEGPVSGWHEVASFPFATQI